MPVSCYLVVHPKGTLIFDTGLGDRLIGLPPYLAKRGTMTQVVLKTLRSQLTEIGYVPETISYLALSHMHFDHVGNANDFVGPATTWLVTEGRARGNVRRQRRSADDQSFVRRTEDYKSQLLDGDHDLFGDGSVVIVSTPGHTVGHQALFLNLPKTGPIVISGDLYHYASERTLNRMPDRERAAGTPESRTKVDALLKQRSAALWIGHDFTEFAKLKKSPEYYQ